MGVEPICSTGPSRGTSTSARSRRPSSPRPRTSGPLLPTEATWVFVGEGLADWAASSIDSAGDVDGDGLDDLVFGAPQNADGGEYAGKAYLWLGR